MPRDSHEAEEQVQDPHAEEEFSLPDPHPGERIEARFRVTLDAERYSTVNVSRVGLFVEGLAPSQRKRLELEIEVPAFGSYRLTCVVVHVIDEERARREEVVPGTGLLVLSAEEPYYDLMHSCIKAAHREKEQGRGFDPANAGSYLEFNSDLRWGARGAAAGTLGGEVHTVQSELSPCQTGETGFRLISDEIEIHR